MYALWYEGEHHGLVWPHGMAVVSGEVPTAAARSIWSEFADGGDLATFLKLLSTHTGADVLSLPTFAIVLRSPHGGWQLAARGDGVAQVDGEVVQGSSISTWAERFLREGQSARVGCSARRGDARPLVAGLVRAGGLVWGTPHDDDLIEVARDGDAPGPVPASPVPDAAEGAGADEPTREPAEREPDEEAPEEQRTDAADPVAATSGADEGDHTLDPDDSEPPDASPDPDPAPHQDPTPERPADEPEGTPAQEPAPPAPAGPVIEVPDFARPTQESAPSGRFARQYGDTEIFSVEDAAVRLDEEGEFIAGVPQGSGRPPEPHPDQEDAAPPAEPERRVRSDDDTAPPHEPTAPPQDASRPFDVGEGDHDGHTMLASEFADQATEPEPNPEDVPFGAQAVLGVRCDSGHANPPHRTACHDCGAPLSGEAHRLQRPVLGRLKLPSGEVVELTTPVIIGRNPRVDRYQGTVLPRLVPLSQGHVSSNHLELRLEGWNVLAVDLHSTNGTFLRRQGEAPVRLGERPELLIDGDVLDLGHGVQLTLEGLR